MTYKYLYKTLSYIALLLFCTSTYAIFGGASAKAKINNSAIASHQQSWEYQALEKQNLLDNAVPLSQGFQVMGHNAYNSTAYSSLVHIDPNHTLSITELLELGVRTIEMDYHWVRQTKDFPHGGALLMCHAGDNDVGCSGLERYLHEGVEEVSSWLRKNPKEVLVLYFQDDAEGHNNELKKAVASIDDLIYKQPQGQCKSFAEMVRTTSEEDVLQAGKQVIIMGSSCSGRGAWDGYSWNSIHNYVSGGGQTIKDKSEADCLADTSKQDGAHRIWEDATQLSATFGDPGPAIDAALAAKAARCGIGALSLDKITIGDSRLKASVWSWGVNEPNNAGGNEDCAVSGVDGRFNDVACGVSYRFACMSNGGKNWRISTAKDANTAAKGQAACAAEGAEWKFAVPTNSQQNEWLKRAKAEASVNSVWLNYSDAVKEGHWVTPAHRIDYGEGIIPLTTMKAGSVYQFYMKSVANNCELQWAGGDRGTGERNAKFDCVTKGDLLEFYPSDEAKTNAAGEVSISGHIKSRADGYLCGLEWSSKLDGDGERDGKFDCAGTADPLTLISRSNGSSERIIIRSDNQCGFEWSASLDGDNERNAKFDCAPRYDEFTLYDVKPLDTKGYHEIRVANSGKCLDFEGVNPTNGSEAVVWNCVNVNWQQWKYEASTGLLRNKQNPNFCLDSGPGVEGNTPFMWPCTPSARNHQWERAGATFRARVNSSLVLDGAQDSKAVRLLSYNGGASQQWSGKSL